MAEIGGSRRRRPPLLLLALVAIVAVSASCRVEVRAGNAPPPPARTPAALPVDLFRDVAPVVECEFERPMWTTPPVATTTEGLLPRAVAQQLADAHVRVGRTDVHQLAPTDIATADQTDAMRRDALHMVNGFAVSWYDASGEVAVVHVEQFDSDASAEAYQHDHAEDHCYFGDRFFATPTIIGGVGFRCRCTSTTVTDRVSVVRGSFRIQVIEWSVPDRDGPDAALLLAHAALAIIEHTAMPTPQSGATA